MASRQPEKGTDTMLNDSASRLEIMGHLSMLAGICLGVYLLQPLGPALGLTTGVFLGALGGGVVAAVFYRLAQRKRMENR